MNSRYAIKKHIQYFKIELAKISLEPWFSNHLVIVKGGLHYRLPWELAGRFQLSTCSLRLT